MAVVVTMTGTEYSELVAIQRKYGELVAAIVSSHKVVVTRNEEGVLTRVAAENEAILPDEIRAEIRACVTAQLMAEDAIPYLYNENDPVYNTTNGYFGGKWNELAAHELDMREDPDFNSAWEDIAEEKRLKEAADNE